MEKSELLAKISEAFTPEELNKYIVIQDKVMPFTMFFDEVLSKYIGESASPQKIVDLINKNFKEKMFTLEELKVRKINKFVRENVPLENQEAFTQEALSHINDSLKFNMGELERDIEYFYEIFLKNYVDNTYSKEEIKDSLEVYLNAYLEPEYQEYVLEMFDMTVRQFVLEALSEKIDEHFEINADFKLALQDDLSLDENVNSVEEIVEQVCSYVHELVKSEEEKKINEANRVLDNPSNVPEIKTIINDKNELEVTGEIPIITTLTDDELTSLIVDIPESELLQKLIDDINEYLVRCNNQDKVKWISIQIDALKNYIQTKDDNNNFELYLQFVLSKLEEIKQNVIKIDSNKADYVDAMFGQLPYCKDSSDLLILSDEIEKKDIKDKQLKETVNREKREMAKKNIIADFKKINTQKFFIDAEIEYRIIEIKRLKKELEFENASNNYIAGMQIKYEVAIKDFERFINNVSISDEERNSYINIINDILNKTNDLSYRKGIVA